MHVWIGLALIATCGPTPAAQDGSPRIEFTVSMPRPATHLYHVRMSLTGFEGEHLDLAMPVWTPGSYKVRDYARFVQDFESGGLPFEKLDKTTWRIHHNGKRAEVSYRVFGHDLSVRHNHLDSEHGTIVGAATFFAVKGHEHRPIDLKIEPFGNWRAATGLDLVEGTRFRAANFDILIDSPIEVADFQDISFKVRDVPHRIVVSGRCPVKMEQLRDDYRKIVEATVDLFDHVPYRHYTFLIRALPGGGGGGLEHLNSSLMSMSTQRLSTEDGYRRTLGLVAHEFFHTWLVKRLRPIELGPFDYSKENHTKLLWVMEGITSYYSPIILRRAGLLDVDQSLESFAGTLEDMAQTPGRLRESPEMASFNAWIHHYQRGPYTGNTTASYYSTGKVRGLLLDLEIRRRSGRTLDDVLRGLYRNITLKEGRGITPEEFEQASEAVVGGSLEEIFEKTIRGTEDPDFAGAFSHVGIELKDDGEAEPWLGVRFDGNVITSVTEGGPAWGVLSVDDELLAIDRVRVTAESWKDFVEPKKEGETLSVTVFRRGLLTDVEVKVQRRAAPDYKLKRVEKPSKAQQTAFRAWLGQ